MGIQLREAGQGAGQKNNKNNLPGNPLALSQRDILSGQFGVA